MLFGAGYDTRSLRYEQQGLGGARFFEVDLPPVVAGKSRLHASWKERTDRPNAELPAYVPFDLNDCLRAAADGGDGGDAARSASSALLSALRAAGLRDAPTIFVFEAVLFYVEEDAVRDLTADLAAFVGAQSGDSAVAGSAICYTDSLKPHVPRSFTHEAKAWFESDGLELLAHSACWGGAVHFAVATSGGAAASLAEAADGETAVAAPATSLADEMIAAEAYGGERPVSSYTPTSTRGNDALLAKLTYDDTWYAVGYAWQVTDDKPFATRLWGEPLVLYRDETGGLTAVEDRCPHRSAPLSMGSVEKGKLRCFYHGWSFGKDGSIDDIPTARARAKDSMTMAATTSGGDADEYVKAPEGSAGTGASSSSSCKGAHTRAVVEHEGLVWVWRGETLAADVRRLPTIRPGESTLPIDTVLDYNVDWCYIVENNLDSPHLFWLHDGSVPPVASLKFDRAHVGGMRLKAFSDACGFGHLGETAGGKPKIVRFDPPNVVRHAGVSGFQEEFHIVPIAPGRTRVLLRQHLPKGPILTTLSTLPGFIPFITWLVRQWNYHIGLEDYSVMQGQAHNIDDLGAARIERGGLGDDIIARFYDWRAAATKNAGKPFFGRWATSSRGAAVASSAQPAAASPYAAATPPAYQVADDQIRGADGRMIGTVGIKQVHPAADYPPVNYKGYTRLLAADRAIKGLGAAVGAPVRAAKDLFHGDASPCHRPRAPGQFAAAMIGCTYVLGPVLAREAGFTAVAAAEAATTGGVAAAAEAATTAVPGEAAAAALAAATASAAALVDQPAALMRAAEQLVASVQ